MSGSRSTPTGEPSMDGVSSSSVRSAKRSTSRPGGRPRPGRPGGSRPPGSGAAAARRPGRWPRNPAAAPTSSAVSRQLGQRRGEAFAGGLGVRDLLGRRPTRHPARSRRPASRGRRVHRGLDPGAGPGGQVEQPVGVAGEVGEDVRPGPSREPRRLAQRASSRASRGARPAGPSAASARASAAWWVSGGHGPAVCASRRAGRPVAEDAPVGGPG